MTPGKLQSTQRGVTLCFDRGPSGGSVAGQPPLNGCVVTSNSPLHDRYLHFDQAVYSTSQFLGSSSVYCHSVRIL